MDPKNITLLVWDEAENFHQENTKRQFGDGNLYKQVINFSSEQEFVSQIVRNDSILENDQLLFCCHINYKDFRGYFNLRNSGIEQKFNIPKVIFLSSGESVKVMNDLYDKYKKKEVVILYSELFDEIKLDKHKPFIKRTLTDPVLSERNQNQESRVTIKGYQDCEYAIVTALEEDEMEKVLPMIIKEGQVENDIHLIEFGFFKTNPSKKIAYASQLTTGMVDASILATEMLIRFNPKFLIMCGVLGGKPNDVEIGDIIVATKVFTIDKGKLTSHGFLSEIESSNTDSAFITKFKRNRESIIDFIVKKDQTRKKEISIHFGSIACVRHVIDIEGYFETEIQPKDRRAIALEMESYGISRACELVNNGRTIPLIIKSVMDNTQQKSDDAKSYAAWTSAMFIRYILENDLI